MSRWRIYYADGYVVSGVTEQDWRAAPDVGVQVVIRFPMRDPLGWSCNGVPVRDRDLWTGEDIYDPFVWGEKHGSLIDTDAYFRIWERACTDPSPEVSRGDQ